MKTRINRPKLKLKSPVIAVAVATLFAVPVANAATRAWVGGAAGNETNFDTAANWSPNGTPGATNDLTINAEAESYPNVTGASVLALSPQRMQATASYHNDVSRPLRELAASITRVRHQESEAAENPKIPNSHVDSPDPVIENGFDSSPPRAQHSRAHP